jgi:hypothetical protein
MIRPRQFPFYPEHVPEELKAGQFWVCCDAEKVPKIPGKIHGASSTDPDTWRTYDEAVTALKKSAALQLRYAGVGRVIVNEDPYVGVDLDNVRDPHTRAITVEAMSILESVSSYSEVSPSGTGVKVWVRARLERSYVKPGLEVYQRGRYFTTTGQFLPQFHLTIQERQREIEALIAEGFSRAKQGPRAYDGPAVDLGRYLRRVEVLAEVHDEAGTKFAIRCPWIDEHSKRDPSGTYVGQKRTGATWFHCWHAHCHKRGWREFKKAIFWNRRFTIGRPDYAGPSITVEVRYE